MNTVVPAAASLLAVFALTGCTGGRTVFAYSIATGGDVQRGKAVITRYGCGSCHTIPGIENAAGMVGPPLILFGRRTYIAGEVANSPENLVHWLLDPKSIEAGTAMPALGLSDQEARDAAAFLYTLRSRGWSGGGE